MKIMTPYEEIIAMEGLAWAADFTDLQIKIIGTLELLAAIGMSLPFIIKKFKFFVPLSSLGLVLLMIAAVITHVVRGEPFIPNVVLVLLAVAVTYLRRDLFRTSRG